MLFLLLIILLLICQMRITILQHTLARVYNTKIQELMSTEASRNYVLEPRLLDLNERPMHNEPKNQKVIFTSLFSNTFDLSPKVLNAFHTLDASQKGLLFLKADVHSPSLFTNEKTFELFWRSCHTVGIESAKYFQDALLAMNLQQRLAIETLLEQNLNTKKQEIKKDLQEIKRDSQELKQDNSEDGLVEPNVTENEVTDTNFLNDNTKDTPSETIDLNNVIGLTINSDDKLQENLELKVKKEKKSRTVKNKHDKVL